MSDAWFDGYSDAKDNSGSAFPGPFSQDRGMSLRDWFAGQALVGLLASNTDYAGPDAPAVEAYQVADAMLEARK